MLFLVILEKYSIYNECITFIEGNKTNDNNTFVIVDEVRILDRANVQLTMCFVLNRS